MIVFSNKFETFVKQNIQKTHAVLLHGTAPDAIRRNTNFILDLILGSPRDSERLTELSSNDVKQDPAILDDAIRARSFFPGRRVVVVHQATDGLENITSACLDDMQNDDALLIMTAGKLAKTSKLRKAFESRDACISTPFYEENLSHLQIQQKLHGIHLDTNSDLEGVARELSTLSASQVDIIIETLETAALDKQAVSLETYLPRQTETDFQDVIQAALLRDLNSLIRSYGILIERKQSLVTLVILLSKELGGLLRLRILPSQHAHQKLRSSYFGTRQQTMISALSIWKEVELSKALHVIHDVDTQLRSTSQINMNIFVLRKLIQICKA